MNLHARTAIASTLGSWWRCDALKRWLLSIGLGTGVLLSGCSMPPRNMGSMVDESHASATASTSASVAPSRQANSTLGTQWGEGRTSRVVNVDATRITPDRPQAMRSMRYTDEASILGALGANADSQRSVLLDDGKIEWSVLDGSGRPLPIYTTRGGDDYRVAGRHGERYELVYVNRSQRNYELVATVDGLDVLSGQPGSTSAGGYLLRAGERLRIEGFRKSNEEVATFRFSTKDNAYASNTPAGNPRNIGVIGTALFEVRIADARPAQPVTRPAPRGGLDAFPADQGRYAQPPQYR